MEKDKNTDINNYFQFNDLDSLSPIQEKRTEEDKKHFPQTQEINEQNTIKQTNEQNNRKTISKEEFKKEFLEKEKKTTSNQTYKERERKKSLIKTLDIIAICVFSTIYACFITIGFSVYLGLKSNKRLLEEIGYFSKSDEFEQLIKYFDSQVLQFLIQPYAESQEIISNYIAIPGLILIIITIIFFIIRYKLIKNTTKNKV